MDKPKPSRASEQTSRFPAGGVLAHGSTRIARQVVDWFLRGSQPQRGTRTSRTTAPRQISGKSQLSQSASGPWRALRVSASKCFVFCFGVEPLRALPLRAGQVLVEEEQLLYEGTWLQKSEAVPTIAAEVQVGRLDGHSLGVHPISQSRMPRRELSAAMEYPTTASL